MELAPQTLNTWNLLKELSWVEALTEGRLHLSGWQQERDPSEGFSLEPAALSPGAHLIDANGPSNRLFRGLRISDSAAVQAESQQLKLLHLNSPIRAIEVLEEWVQLSGKGSVAYASAKSWQSGSPGDLSGWLPKSATGIPAFYRSALSLPELERRLPELDERWTWKLAGDLMAREKKKMLDAICAAGSIEAAAPPDLLPGDHAYYGIVTENKLGFYDRLLLGLALLPQVKPLSLEKLLMRGGDRVSPLAGGQRGPASGVFLPTGQTFLFVAAGEDAVQRVKALRWLCCSSIVMNGEVVKMEKAQAAELYSSGPLSVTAYYLQLLLMNAKPAIPAQNT